MSPPCCSLCPPPEPGPGGATFVTRTMELETRRIPKSSYVIDSGGGLLDTSTTAMPLKFRTFLEHPLGSLAWRVRETATLRSLPGMKNIILQQCMFVDDSGSTNKKPTLCRTSALW
eukprot:TRINITY_DN44439_c0_g1_i1.p2 TRINITY_DN44439_c0_g1~~TRINITY_DN44439_c0_g1_i1.p2  ORF type:complete len:116 (+),score=10.08 TRINITY_DN44439_c0_g1_i1:332-679(+)